jgi:hypothetical protein
MPQERRWCKYCARMTWHHREWRFPRSQGWGLIALLALPFVWWYDPWNWMTCDRRAREELAKCGFNE